MNIMDNKTHRSTFVALLILLFTSGNVVASEGARLSDQASDPRNMRWMVGFPPEPSLRITQPDSNYFSFPKLRWSVCHLRELLPTARVRRNPYLALPFEYALDAGIERVTFSPMNSNTDMTWQESLSANYTDGLLILHKGKVVYEYYSGCLSEHTLHAAMSMTKSFTGLIAQILISNGELDETALVSSIIPELSSSAFGDATVRQVMNMTTALDYSENYADPNADIWIYSKAASPMPKAPDYDGPEGYFEYLQTVRKKGVHGEEFGYKTVNSDVLGWIIARTTGMAFEDAVHNYLWDHLGVENDAYITVDGLGTAFAGGGLSATLRDLGRLGQMMLDDGKVNGLQLVPEEAIDAIRRGGDKEVFAKGGFTTLTGGSYQSMWWVFHNDNGAYAARGVHGQTVYIDPTAEMVLVRLASFPVSANSKIDPTSLPAYQAVADYLMSKN